MASTASSCYSLSLPPIDKDDRNNLNVRTGSVSTLHNSYVFTHGGLTIPLEIKSFQIEEIVSKFNHYCTNTPVATPSTTNVPNKSRNLSKYLSGELFYLNILEKKWIRFITNDLKPRPRLFHQICCIHNCLYLFGGLVISNTNTLAPTNDLWELNLNTNKWTCLHNGLNYTEDRSCPSPRYNHKLSLVSNISFMTKKKNHYGLLITGGQDSNSMPIYENYIFDLVDKKYVDSNPIRLSVENDHEVININQYTGMIVNFIDELKTPTKKDKHNTEQEESLIVYGPTTSQNSNNNTLINFKIGKKKIKQGNILHIHHHNIEKELLSIPYNLKYPTGGIFGQNIVITGFLPGELNISLFIYNKPTGKWSKLNIFCNHTYGSHRFWGGFVWQSHHKVILLGNNLTSSTTSSVRYFSLMLTISLPITNVLASSELQGGHYHAPDGSRIYFKDLNNSSSSSSCSISLDTNEEKEEEEMDPKRKRSSISSSSSEKSPTAISFTEYVHYAAPKTSYTTIRSVFPPTAVTLGRNAFDRYGDMISDFEIISSNGDRIPVALIVLMERWGRHFIYLLSKAYLSAIERFEEKEFQEKKQKQEENHQQQQIHSQPNIVKPQFRLPFQDASSLSLPEDFKEKQSSVSSAVDPHQQLQIDLNNLPPQPPLPQEPIPATPTSSTQSSFKSTSRKNSQDLVNSPRASLINTLTQLRNIPTRSPRDSPFSSPRASISIGGQNRKLSLNDERPSLSTINSDESGSSKGSVLPTIHSDFQMEASLIPRKLYFPFKTVCVRAFCEYLYTGQIGNKWLLAPTLLDNMIIAKMYKVPLLYDLISEVLFGIIGRKEFEVSEQISQIKKEQRFQYQNDFEEDDDYIDEEEEEEDEDDDYLMIDDVEYEYTISELINKPVPDEILSLIHQSSVFVLDFHLIKKIRKIKRMIKYVKQLQEQNEPDQQEADNPPEDDLIDDMLDESKSASKAVSQSQLSTPPPASALGTPPPLQATSSASSLTTSGREKVPTRKKIHSLLSKTISNKPEEIASSASSIKSIGKKHSFFHRSKK